MDFKLGNVKHRETLTSIPGYKSAPKPISVTDKSEYESACLRSPCNLQCDCKCSLLAAELEGVKLDMAIMQRNIESNTVSANITRAEEVEPLKQELANKREKNRQLEEDTSVLVSGRNSEIAELNDIINSLQNKLESKGFKAIHKQSPTAGISIHKLDTTKDYLSNETKEYLPSKQNTTYSSAKQDVLSGLCLNKEGKIECELQYLIKLKRRIMQAKRQYLPCI